MRLLISRKDIIGENVCLDKRLGSQSVAKKNKMLNANAVCYILVCEMKMFTGNCLNILKCTSII